MRNQRLEFSVLVPSISFVRHPPPTSSSVFLESCMAQPLKSHSMNWTYYMDDLDCLIWNPEIQIPWKDGLSVDLLCFEVSIGMVLLPSLVYLHLQVWNVKQYQGKSEDERVLMMVYPSILNEMSEGNEFKQSWTLLFLFPPFLLLFFFKDERTKIKSTIENFPEFLAVPTNARVNSCLKSNFPLADG